MHSSQGGSLNPGDRNDSGKYGGVDEVEEVKAENSS